MTILNTLATTLLSSVLALTSCASTSRKSGRIIEFTSDANGFNTKTIFYEAKEEVVAFDAQFTESHAKAAIEHLRKFTNKPISFLVITHPNPDKFNGASVFQKEGTKVIASKLTRENMKQVHEYKKYYFVKIAKMFTDKTYPQMPIIDEVFNDELVIRLKGGESIYLKEYGQAGVSLNQTVAEIPNTGVLIVGDLIHHNAHAWLEGGIFDGKAKPTLTEWINLLEDLKKDYKSDIQVYGGRGDAVTLDFAVNDQVAYLQKADELTTEYINSLGQAKNELETEKAEVHYNQLSEIFKSEFPNYKHEYMIQYGIYGLVNSKL